MSEEKNYIPPPNNKENIFKKFKKFRKDVHSYAERDYRRSLIPQMLIVIPILFLLYLLVLGFLFSSIFGDPQNPFIILLIQIAYIGSTIFLTYIAALFYPYSVFWYSNSFFGRFFDNFYFFGSFLQVVLKKLFVMFGHVFLAGLFSPIMGLSTWKKLKRKNKTILKNRI